MDGVTTTRSDQQDTVCSAVGVEGDGWGLEVVTPGGWGAAVPVDRPGDLRCPPDGVEHRGGEVVRGEHGHGDVHRGHPSWQHAGGYYCSGLCDDDVRSWHCYYSWYNSLRDCG